MSNLGARFYATTKGTGDEAAALAVRGALGTALRERLDSGSITGYEATAVMREEDWEDEGMDREIIEAVSGGALPVVAVNITYDADDPRQRDADHADLIDAFGLRLAFEINPSR